LSGLPSFRFVLSRLFLVSFPSSIGFLMSPLSNTRIVTKDLGRYCHDYLFFYVFSFSHSFAVGCEMTKLGQFTDFSLVLAPVDVIYENNARVL
jgi:hypothetical protein